MKRILSIAMAALVAVGAAWADVETVYLKNGSVIKGTVIEQIPGQSLKLKTRDGSVFVYNMNEVERIAKEQQAGGDLSLDPSCCRHSGLDFSIGSGVNIATKGSSASIPIDLILSKRFSPYFQAGIGSGIYIGTESGSKPDIPLYADFKGFLPLQTSKLTPFADIQIGELFTTASDKTVGEGEDKTTVKFPNRFMLSIMPGVRIPLNHRADVDLSLGYQHYMADGGSAGAFAVKAAFNFHRSTDKEFQAMKAEQRAEKRRIKQLEKEMNNFTRARGFELGFEMPWNGSYGGLGIQLGYKFSQCFSLAANIGFQSFGYDSAKGAGTYYSEPNAQGKVVEEFDIERSKNMDITTPNFYIRGQYRILGAKRFSPIASLDLGYCYLDECFVSNLEGPIGYIDIDKTKGVFTATPAVGISFRTTKNSFIEARIGYKYLPEVGGVNQIKDFTDSYSHNGAQSYQLKTDKVNLSCLFIGISWKHTFYKKLKYNK